ncbi:MAG TPA: metallophosphoesterase [Puia sp.]
MKLEIGYNHPVEVRRYGYPFGPLAGKRIMYISDLHYHRLSRRRVDRNIQQVRRLNPDILLLGGDYVDTPFGLGNFERFVGCMGEVPLFAIGGNHDGPYLRSIQRIVENAGGMWIHNDSAILHLNNIPIRIDGTRPFTTEPEVAEPAAAGFSILCLHHPTDVSAIAHRYNLIFAGHLHGSQIVLWQTPRGLYPGRWIYPLNQLAIENGASRFFISKGLGDTLPIRYQCSRDLILINLEPSTHQS